MRITIILGFAVLLISAYALVHPTPLVHQSNEGSIQLRHVCNIYHFPAQHDLIDSQYYFNKITKRLNRNLQCPKTLTYVQDIHTPLNAIRKAQLKSEAYEIIIDKSGIQIFYSDYSGYVYALQTFSQLVGEGNVQHVYLKDQPKFTHRGIMIDSARHFLKVKTIQRLIESMPQSKLNIIHWRLMDDESFPLRLGAHPEISQHANYSSQQTYSIDDIKNLLSLAKKNAVQIMPEVNTPSHVRSWVQAPEWKDKNLTLKCNRVGKTAKYSQIIDPSKAQALKLVRDVVAELDNLFYGSPYIHLGGDSVDLECWNTTNAIKTFMKLHHITTLEGLVEYWRFQVKQAIPPNRKVIYWIDEVQSYTTSQNDILQFSGNSSLLSKVMKSTSSKFILSPFDIFDLTSGFSNLWMNQTNNNYSSWRHIYQNFSRIINAAGVDQTRILGAELLLWGTVINNDNFQNNVWMRSAVFAERLWSNTRVATYELITSMVKIQRSLQAQGIDVSPLTSQYCEYRPSVCWPLLKDIEHSLPIVMIE